MRRISRALKKRGARKTSPRPPEPCLDEVLGALTLTGKPDRCVERLKDYRKAGVNLPIIMPIGDVNAAIKTFAP